MTGPELPRPRVPVSGTVLLGAGIVVVIACLVLFAGGDQAAAQFCHADTPGFAALRRAAGAITVLGSSTIYLAPALTFCLVHRLFLRGRGAPATRERLARLAGVCLFLFVAVVVSGLLVDLLKIGFGRARPTLLFHQGAYGFEFFQFTAQKWSFPSGHANTICAVATVCWLVKPKGWPLYVAVAVLVAASRVIVGDHYPSDVLMGGYLGVLTTVGLKPWFQRRGADIFPEQ